MTMENKFKELGLRSHFMQHSTKYKFRRHGLTIAVVKARLWGDQSHQNRKF